MPFSCRAAALWVKKTHLAHTVQRCWSGISYSGRISTLTQVESDSLDWPQSSGWASRLHRAGLWWRNSGGLCLREERRREELNKRADRNEMEDRQSDRHTGSEQLDWQPIDGTFQERHCPTKRANTTAPLLFSLSHLLLSCFTFFFSSSPSSATSPPPLQSDIITHWGRTQTSYCLGKHTLAGSHMNKTTRVTKVVDDWVILWCRGNPVVLKEQPAPSIQTESKGQNNDNAY